jgi:hypothetical protein
LKKLFPLKQGGNIFLKAITSGPYVKKKKIVPTIPPPRSKITLHSPLLKQKELFESYKRTTRLGCFERGSILTDGNRPIAPYKKPIFIQVPYSIMFLFMLFSSLTVSPT